MTINIEKKQLLIGTIIIGIALLAILGIRTMKNSVYMKHAKECQKDITLLYYASSLLSAELHDTWSDYIMKDKTYMDKRTGKFYESRWDAPTGTEIQYCYNFSEAIAEKASLYERKGINTTIDSLYSSAKTIMTKMTPAPKKYAEIHLHINDLFHTAEAMYNCAVSPEGSLKSYTDAINLLSADYKRQKSQVDIEIGEIDEKELSEQQLYLLLKFL